MSASCSRFQKKLRPDWRHEWIGRGAILFLQLCELGGNSSRRSTGTGTRGVGRIFEPNTSIGDFNGGWQNESSFSDGTLRLIGLLWFLSEGSSPLLLEEPELSLHAAAVRQIPRMLAKLNASVGRQVLMTSHSAGLLADQGIDPSEVIVLSRRLITITSKTAESAKVVARSFGQTPLSAPMPSGVEHFPANGLLPIDDLVSAKLIAPRLPLLNDDRPKKMRKLARGAIERLHPLRLTTHDGNHAVPSRSSVMTTKITKTNAHGSRFSRSFQDRTRWPARRELPAGQRRPDGESRGDSTRVPRPHRPRGSDLTRSSTAMDRHNVGRCVSDPSGKNTYT
jgi:hypothetical protein